MEAPPSTTYMSPENMYNLCTRIIDDVNSTTSSVYGSYATLWKDYMRLQQDMEQLRNRIRDVDEQNTRLRQQLEHRKILTPENVSGLDVKTRRAEFVDDIIQYLYPSNRRARTKQRGNRSVVEKKVRELLIAYRLYVPKRNSGQHNIIPLGHIRRAHTTDSWKSTQAQLNNKHKPQPDKKRRLNESRSTSVTDVAVQPSQSHRRVQCQINLTHGNTNTFNHINACTTIEGGNISASFLTTMDSRDGIRETHPPETSYPTSVVRSMKTNNPSPLMKCSDLWGT